MVSPGRIRICVLFSFDGEFKDEVILGGSV
jgi:hypothetical protein